MRWQGREAAEADHIWGVILRWIWPLTHPEAKRCQLRMLITRSLVDSRLEPAQECLLLAGSDEQNPMIQVRGVDHLRELYPEVVQQEWHLKIRSFIEKVDFLLIP